MDKMQVKCPKTPENVNKTEILLITAAIFAKNGRPSVSIDIVSYLTICLSSILNPLKKSKVFILFLLSS